MTRTGAPQRAHRAVRNSSEHQVSRVGNSQQWDSPLESDGEEDSWNETVGQSGRAGPRAERRRDERGRGTVQQCEQRPGEQSVSPSRTVSTESADSAAIQNSETLRTRELEQWDSGDHVTIATAWL